MCFFVHFGFSVISVPDPMNRNKKNTVGHFFCSELVMFLKVHCFSQMCSNGEAKIHCYLSRKYTNVFANVHQLEINTNQLFTLLTKISKKIFRCGQFRLNFHSTGFFLSNEFGIRIITSI